MDSPIGNAFFYLPETLGVPPCTVMFGLLGELASMVIAESPRNQGRSMNDELYHTLH